MNCPNCNAEIESQDLTAKNGLAKCPSCDHVFKISHNLENRADDGFELYSPPKGAWIKSERNKVIIGASKRSPTGFFLIPFTMVWSGGSLWGIYGQQFIKGDLDLFLSLFGIPFVIGTVFLLYMTLTSIWGKVELTLDKYGGYVFTGIGGLGQKREFSWKEINSVKEEKRKRPNGTLHRFILFDGHSAIPFGKGLSKKRRHYLFRALEIILSKVKSNRSII